ncbi:MAG: hypothetical protein ACO3SY_06560 [Flavobacteriaceae bacterium]
MNYITRKRFSLLQFLFLLLFTLFVYETVSDWQANKTAFMEGFNSVTCSID